MRKVMLSFLLCILMLMPSTLVNAASSQQFTDMSTDHWAYQAVMQMVDKGILEGYSDGTFRPNDPVTRAQFAKILVLSMGLPLDYSGEQTFTDVSSGDWSYPYVEAAQKYLTGYKNQQDGKFYFKGDNVAVREDMAVAVVIAKDLNTQNADFTALNSFSDISNMSQTIRKYIAIAVANGIMDGYGNGLFGPQGTLTRAEAAELMYKSGILSGNGDKVAMGDGDDQSSQDGNAFDLKTVKVGDKVAEMTVTDIEPPIYGDGIDGIGTITYSGQTTISGTYEVVFSQLDAEDQVILSLDEESKNKIPAFNGEKTSIITLDEYVIDKNTMTKFGAVGTEGKFKIVIDNYYDSFLIESHNSAKIVRIIELTKTTTSTDDKESSAIQEITVKNAKELFEAIGSNRKIVLAQGVYNLSDISTDNLGYNENAYFEDVFDGKQLIVTNVSNLTIEGAGNNLSQIVVEPRYANILAFLKSENISIKNIVAGHTPEKGSCAGGVLYFEDSNNIRIDGSDLYGCGIEGLTLDNVDVLTFDNSVIHDCSQNVMTISNSRHLDFTNSQFNNNEGGITIGQNSNYITFDTCKVSGEALTKDNEFYYISASIKPTIR